MDKKPMQENKMGVMPVGRLLINMSLPMMASMLVSARYNVVDSMFVSRISENALTALSLAFPVQNLMIAVSVGMGVGLNAVLSRALGAKDHKTVERAAANGLLITLVCAAAAMLMGMTLIRPYFAAQTDIAEIVDSGVIYTTIVSVGSLGMFLQIFFERLLQSTGRTALTMTSQITGAVINIILDPIMIFGLMGMPRMGVAGAALATILGQWIGACVGFTLCMKKNPEIRLSLRAFRPSAEMIRRIMVIGVPSVIMQSIGSVMTFLLNQILIAFSATAVAVFGVYFKLQSFIFMPIFGMNNGTVPIIAYNYGAKRPDRMMQAVRYSVTAAISIMICGMLVFHLATEQLLAIFDASAEMLRIGVPALRIISLSFPVAGFCIGCGTVFQALGYSIYSMINSLVRQLVVLIPCAFVIGRLTGDVTMVWYAFVIAETFSLMLTIVFFRRIHQNVIKRI